MFKIIQYISLTVKYNTKILQYIFNKYTLTHTHTHTHTHTVFLLIHLQHITLSTHLPAPTARLNINRAVKSCQM